MEQPQYSYYAINNNLLPENVVMLSRQCCRVPSSATCSITRIQSSASQPSRQAEDSLASMLMSCYNNTGISRDGAISSLKNEISRNEAIRSLNEIFRNGDISSLNEISRNEAIRSLNEISRNGAISSLDEISRNEAIRSLNEISRNEDISSLNEISGNEAIRSLNEIFRNGAIDHLIEYPGMGLFDLLRNIQE